VPKVGTAIQSVVGMVVFVFALSEVAGADCQNPENEIVRENCLPGSPQAEWHAPASALIRGFTTEISIDKGEEVHFLVDTPGQSGVHYDLDIYRLGYYQGQGARKIRSFLNLVSVSQPDCSELVPTPSLDPGNDAALITNGRVCNWSSPVIWQTSEVPEIVSGLFMAKLTRRDITPPASSLVFFVIRDDDRDSEILLQTSDTTWQAYNAGPKFPNATPVPPGCLPGGYPAESYLHEGAALYPRNLFLPNDPSVNGVAGRAYKVSQSRPHVFSFGFSCDGSRMDWDSAQNLVFDFEYPLVRFLEKNGYDVGYIAGRDVARTPTLLLGPPGGLPPHKIFVTSGHDEYWSGEQKATIEAARNAGVHLASFAGNQGYVKIRWEDDFHSIVCYRDGWDPSRPVLKLDPLAGVTTGLFRDPRFGAPLNPSLDGYRPENATFGQLTSLYAADAPIAVPDLSLRQWRGVTNPATVQCIPPPFGAECRLLGPEIDGDADNGFRPHGLFHLSSTTLENQSHADGYFSQFERGQSARVEHHLTLYRATPPPNGEGALVFSAGTMRLQWGLAGMAGYAGVLASHPVVPGLQQLVVNVFADMGVQPGSLQEPGVVAAAQSTDTSAPVATMTTQASGTARALETLIVSGIASDTGGSNPSGKVAAVEVSTDGGGSWHPTNGRGSWQFSFTPCSTSGSISVKARAVDDSGNVGAGSPAQIVTLTPLPSPSGSAYYLRNGTFECGFEPTDSDGVGREWLKLLPSPSPQPPPQFHNAGLVAGITMQRVASTATGVGIRQDLKLQPGRKYKISARVYAEQGQARLAIRFSGQTVDLASAMTTSATPVWETLSFDYTPTQTDHTLVIYGNTLAPGSCFTPSTAATCFKVDDVRVDPPLSLTATAVSAGQINAQWAPPAGHIGVHHYDLERSFNGAPYVRIAQIPGTGTTYTDTAVSAGTTYLYRVLAFDASNNSSGMSNVDPATTLVFTDNPIQVGVTVIKAQHIVELRQAVNAVRASAGLSPATWTDTSLPGIPVKAAHILELRSALDQALVAVGLAALPYSDPILTPGFSPIRRAHIEEIRQRVN
jgi:hypothetical protein